MADYTSLSPEELEKAQAKLLIEAVKLIKDTKFNYVRFNNVFEYLNRKVTFRKVDENSAQVTMFQKKVAILSSQNLLTMQAANIL